MFVVHWIGHRDRFSSTDFLASFQCSKVICTFMRFVWLPPSHWPDDPAPLHPRTELIHLNMLKTGDPGPEQHGIQKRSTSAVYDRRHYTILRCCRNKTPW